MEKIVFGHQNPDTDSICSALVFALGEQAKGTKIEAVALGTVNQETKYVLDYLKMNEPRVITKVENGQPLVMVDHNEFTQSVENIENAEIIAVYDHHRVANFTTKDQVLMNVQPLGCTATILYEKFELEKIEISFEMAILMISAIVSDSLLFKSPTCTEKDQKVARLLAEKIELDLEEYGLNMLKAGTNLSQFTAEELLDVDTKKIQNNNSTYEIGQINTVDIKEIVAGQGKDIVQAIEKRISSKELDAFLFVITDIINSNSIAYCLGKDAETIAQKLGKNLEEDLIDLPGVVSRKKQIVPFI